MTPKDFCKIKSFMSNYRVGWLVDGGMMKNCKMLEYENISSLVEMKF